MAFVIKGLKITVNKKMNILYIDLDRCICRCLYVFFVFTIERMEEEYDDVGIEEEIEFDLGKINYSSYETDDCNTDLSAESSSDSETVSIPEEYCRSNKKDFTILTL